MKIYELKSNQQRVFIPDWHFDPATPRQLKVLRFFGKAINEHPPKGVCSGVIGKLFSNSDNKHLWNAYVYTTGDEDYSSSELQPHDMSVLANTEIPSHWKPKRGPSTPSKTHNVLEQLVAEILQDGSPFDDPLPSVSIPGTVFCFTAKFDFGSREECEMAVTSRGGIAANSITGKIDVLVIGQTPNSSWSHGNYGNKILNAMLLKLRHRKPLIIPELYWRALLDESDGKDRTMD